MKHYKVTWQEIIDVTVDVDAESEDEAFDMARNGDVEPQTGLAELVPDSLCIVEETDSAAIAR